MELPTTHKERLEQDRAFWYELKSALQKAIMQLMTGDSVVSYSIGGRSVTRSRADIGSMRSQLRECDAMIDEIEAQLCGRPLRAVSQGVFITPNNSYWRP